MELLLNLVWLIVALGSVSLWRIWWRHGKGASRREWMAFATFLFLIFPVISLTDDLHEELAVAECATGTKHFLSCASRAASHQNVRHNSGTPAGVIRNQEYAVPVLESVSRPLHDVAVANHTVVRLAAGRAPPQIFL